MGSYLLRFVHMSDAPNNNERSFRFSWPFGPWKAWGSSPECCEWVGEKEGHKAEEQQRETDRLRGTAKINPLSLPLRLCSSTLTDESWTCRGPLSWYNLWEAMLCVCVCASVCSVAAGCAVIAHLGTGCCFSVYHSDSLHTAPHTALFDVPRWSQGASAY